MQIKGFRFHLALLIWGDVQGHTLQCLVCVLIELGLLHAENAILYISFGFLLGVEGWSHPEILRLLLLLHSEITPESNLGPQCSKQAFYWLYYGSPQHQLLSFYLINLFIFEIGAHTQ